MTLKITSLKVKIRAFLLSIGLILLSFLSFGQDLKIKLGASSLTTSDQFFISLIVPKSLTKEFNSFAYSSFPEIEGFVKYKTVQNKNKEENTYEIIQYYLPQKTGLVKISPFILKVGTSQAYSQGKSITIRTGSATKGQLFPVSLEFSEDEPDFLFQIIPDKSEIYAGEGFTITASLLIGSKNKVKFQLIDLLPQASHIARSMANDNLLMDNKSKGIIQNPIWDSVQIKNNSYKKLTLYQAKSYPVKAENINVPKINFNLIKYLIAKEGNTIWWKAKDFSLSSKEIKIKVKDLPPHPLKDVVPIGEFHIKEAISSRKAYTGKALSYNIAIHGNGNMNIVLTPLLKENGSLEFYPAKIEFKPLNKEIDQKMFRYKIVPKEPGVYHLSDYFQWVYFDTKENRYDTLKSSIKISVSGEKISKTGGNREFKESFYSLANQQKNNLRSKERDEDIKYFANIFILFMLVSTAILVLKK